MKKIAIVLTFAALAALTFAEKAPAFGAPDTDGKLFKLADFAGKPTLIVFFNGTAPCCAGESLPLIEELKKKHAKLNIVAFVRKSSTEAAAWKRQAKVTFPVLADPKGDIAKKYRANSGQAFQCVDKGGNLGALVVDFDDKKAGEVRAGVQKLLK